MKALSAFTIIAVTFVSIAPAAAADTTPLTFQATRNSDTDYAATWRVRMYSDVPFGAGVQVGMITTTDGDLSSLPLYFLASVGTINESSDKVRRGARVQISPETRQAQLTLQNIQPVWVGAAANLELRQTLDTVIYGEADAGRVAVSANQQVYVTNFNRRTAVTAGARIANDQNGVTGSVRLEQKVLDHWTVAADFAHGEDTNTAAVSARYAFNW